MGCMDEQEVYLAVTRHLAHEPNEAIWQLLRDDGLVEQAVGLGVRGEDPQISIDEVVHRYRQLEALAVDYSEGKVTPQAQSAAPQRTIIEPDLVSRAQAEIAAREAAGHPLVIAFRARYLGDRLLSRDEALAWLEERFSERSFWRRLHLPYWYPRNACARPNPIESRLAVERHIAGGCIEGGNDADNALDFLYCLCDVLVDLYRWDDYTEDVPLYVLSGAPPRPLRGQILIAPPQDGNDLRNSTIAIYVSARMGPREVMERYRRCRAGLLDKDTRVRAVSEKAVDLARFIVRANDGRSWSEALGTWNKHSPEGERYQDTRLFARDCRSAYQRITGRNLNWRGAQGGEGAGPRGLLPTSDPYPIITPRRPHRYPGKGSESVREGR